VAKFCHPFDVKTQNANKLSVSFLLNKYMTNT